MTDRFLNIAKDQLRGLALRDPALGQFISARGIIQRRCYPHPFSALIHSIIGQQISSRAQENIWDRFKQHVFPISPEMVMKTGDSVLRGCGISSRKVQFIKNAACQFDNGMIDEAALWKMTDEEIHENLIRLPGVGLWTVEMLLIFTFQRPDIISFGDLAIRRGLCRLHNIPTLTKTTFKYYKSLYSPYGSVASLYLWEIAAMK